MSLYQTIPTLQILTYPFLTYENGSSTKEEWYSILFDACKAVIAMAYYRSQMKAHALLRVKICNLPHSYTYTVKPNFKPEIETRTIINLCQL